MAKHEHVIIALIPNYGSGEVHSTLCYCGLIYNAPPFEVLCDRTMLLARMWEKIEARVSELRPLGEDQDEPCAMLEGVDLYAVHDFVEEFANSNWGYIPHIAEQSKGDLPAVGAAVVFNRIAVWHGAQRAAWRFGSGAPCAT